MWQHWKSQHVCTHAHIHMQIIILLTHGRHVVDERRTIRNEKKQVKEKETKKKVERQSLTNPIWNGNSLLLTKCCHVTRSSTMWNLFTLLLPLCLVPFAFCLAVRCRSRLNTACCLDCDCGFGLSFICRCCLHHCCIYIIIVHINIVKSACRGVSTKLASHSFTLRVCVCMCVSVCVSCATASPAAQLCCWPAVSGAVGKEEKETERVRQRMDKRTGVSIYTPEGAYTHTHAQKSEINGRPVSVKNCKHTHTHTHTGIRCVCVFVYLLMRIHCHIRHKEIIFAKRSRSPSARGREREVQTVELNCLLRCLTTRRDAGCAAALPCLALPCLGARRAEVSFVALIEIIAKMQMEWTTVDTGY